MMGEETFHPDTRAMLGYGRALAGVGPTPKKGAADQVIERLFVIERAADGRLPVRSFGPQLAALFGRDLRDHDFARLFLAPDLAMLRALISSCALAAAPGVARLKAQTGAGRVLGADMLITPLKLDTAQSQNVLGERFLGMFQPLGGEPFLDGGPIIRLRIGSVHPPETSVQKGPQLVVVND